MQSGANATGLHTPGCAIDFAIGVPAAGGTSVKAGGVKRTVALPTTPQPKTGAVKPTDAPGVTVPTSRGGATPAVRPTRPWTPTR